MWKLTVVAIGVVLVATSGCSHEEPEFLAGGREVESQVEALHDANPQVRKQAVMKLGNVSDADPAAAGALTEALHDTDAQVRRAAIFPVVKLKNPGEAITELLDAMSRTDSEPEIREVAERALKNFNSAN